MSGTNETYNVYQAARALGVTSNRVRVLLAEERLPGAQKVDGQWQIPAAALEPLKQRREALAQ
jgi:hypothetical protein